MKRVKCKRSISFKIYFFLIVTILLVSIGTAIFAYFINADKINKYYKRVASDTARNFGAFADGDYLSKLRKFVETDDFQKIRQDAEDKENESLVQNALEEAGLWEEFSNTRSDIMKYLETMHSVKYLYLEVAGDENSKYDMILMDDEEEPLFITGLYAERDESFYGVDATKEIEPTISNGEWGWLCSAYVPIFDSEGNYVCVVGCDFDMDTVMEERMNALLTIIAIAIVFTVVVLIFAVILLNKILIKPLNSLTVEVSKFKPTVNAGYDAAGVINLEMKNNDEIGDLYKNIRTMQVNIVDYLADIDLLQKDIQIKDEEIDQISEDAYKDALTGVGSKMAYVKKVRDIDAEIVQGNRDFGIVMVDLNDLKRINDEYGHKMGDIFIKGCCHIICEVFKHSPVYRIGGDEFVVILSGEDYENRFERIGELKGKYEQALSDKIVKPWEKYSASVGMAELSSDDLTVDFVFKRADKAMYEEKKKYKEIYGSYR